MSSPITIGLGRAARERIARDGLRAADVSVVPAAAGGPKGLVLNGLDKWIFGEWLPHAPRTRHLVGASIGAWRMAAAAHADPVAAFDRLARLYAGQRYPKKPSAEYVTRVCKELVTDFVGSHAPEILSHATHRLGVLAVRGRGPLAQPGSRRAELLGFALASAANALGRTRLAGYLDRVVFHDPRDGVAWMHGGFDAFHTHFAALSQANLREALLASGSIPFVLEAVGDIAGAPQGAYWDGGIIDYHLHLPYPRAGGIVLYPHFADHVVPGWLDKAWRWRRARGEWLDNVVLVAPSAEFVATLPNRKLPDRKDFARYGLDHDARMRDWMRAVAESERMAEAFARWVEKPDLAVAAAID
ncbi:MAG: patatin-like phospholipase family protein [Burkholderiales bacterium]|nr:patatin-like phospholipase family protein [Burkholderiales bacterium]